VEALDTPTLLLAGEDDRFWIQASNVVLIDRRPGRDAALARDR
jgi:hypothetical protein